MTTTSFGFGSLRLTGDGEANAIRVTRDPAVLSRVLVQALSGTKLNGVENGSAVFLLNRFGSRGSYRRRRMPALSRSRVACTIRCAPLIDPDSETRSVLDSLGVKADELLKALT